MRKQRKRVTGYTFIPWRAQVVRITKKGFTLVEILVATTILVIAMASIYVSFKGGVAAWTKGTARMERYLNARAAMDMMSREIEAAMLATSDLYSIDFVCSADTGGALRFAAARDSSGDWDLIEIAYRYDNTDEEIERAIDVQYNFPADKSQASPSGFSFQPLVSNINPPLEFEFWDASAIPSGWRSDWDSRTAVAEGGGIPGTEDLLPQAVRITIKVQDEQDREVEQTFSTIIYLPRSR